MATPKSNVKLTLEDDEKEGSLAKSVSDSGRPGGASTTRDLSNPDTVDVNGVTTNLAEDEGTLSRVGSDTPEIRNPNDPLGSATNTIPEGFFLINGQLISHADFIDQQSRGTGIEEAAQAEATRNNSTVTPPMSTSGTSSGVPTFPGDAGVAVPESAPAPTVADALANFDISQYMLDPAIGLETPDKIAFQNLLTLTGTDVGAAADALFEAGTTLRGVPTQPITAEFSALISDKDRLSLRGYDSVDIVEHVITNAQGQQLSEFVFLNPATGQPIKDTSGNPLLASGGQFLTDQAEAVNAAARELTSAKIARDDAATIAAKQMVLQNALNRQAQRETDIFHQQGNRYQAMLQAQLDFTSRAALDTASRNFQAEQAQQQREFEANLAEFQANNQFLMQALGFEFQSQQRMMELAWLNGSPEEAKFAREQSREIERRQIALQERELLVSTLAILGQHPQLRGAIQALGLFKGQGGGTGFDFEQFFSGTLPTDAIPSAQEFNLLSPSAQEAMVNDLAGKHGISRDIVIQTIRRQAPAGTRRLA